MREWVTRSVDFDDEVELEPELNRLEKEGHRVQQIVYVGPDSSDSARWVIFATREDIPDEE